MLSRLERFIRYYAIFAVTDALSVVLVFYLALALRFYGQTPLNYLLQLRQYVLLVALTYCFFNALLGLYGRIWDYASSDEIVSIVESVTVGTLLVAAVDLLWLGRRPIPLSVILAGGFFVLGAFTATRYGPRLVRAWLRRWRSVVTPDLSSDGKRVLIVGAGEAGQLLARSLHSQASKYHIVGLVDDDPVKQGMRVHGIKVLGDRQAILGIVQQEAVGLIVIAIHNISSEDFRQILSICESTAATIKTVPDVLQRLGTLGDASLLRDITLEDLVGREPVHISRQDCEALLRGKVILVTGGGGSIGSELCRQIVQFQPRLLVILDNNETSLHDLELELCATQRRDSDAQLPDYRFVVADITNPHRMEGVLREYRPQMVLHAAAYKHVLEMERFPEEAIRVNVGGTLTLLELAKAHAVERFVFVSTDKAVEPASVMGATKRVGELLTAAFNADGGLIATAVRFGNVLGTRGSVVPTFDREIESGGPVTVTDAEATRFFMSVAEAASLILQAASMALDGEMFILEMGAPIRIADLAHKMIRLRGLRVGEDIRIVYTGMRPGEKLHERLVSSFEHKEPTSHPKIFSVRGDNSWDRGTLLCEVNGLLRQLEQEVSGSDLAQRLFAIAKAHANGSPVEQFHLGTEKQ